MSLVTKPRNNIASTRPRSSEMSSGPGFRIRKSFDRPSAELIALFRDFETPDISDILNRMIDRGEVKAADLRIIYESKVFPTSSFSRAHDLKPELAEAIRKCFLDFKFPPEMQAQFNNNTHFVPINYKETWAPIREIAEKTGTPYNKAAFDAQAKREAEAAAKKKQ